MSGATSNVVAEWAKLSIAATSVAPHWTPYLRRVARPACEPMQINLGDVRSKPFPRCPGKSLAVHQNEPQFARGPTDSRGTVMTTLRLSATVLFAEREAHQCHDREAAPLWHQKREELSGFRQHLDWRRICLGMGLKSCSHLYD